MLEPGTLSLDRRERQRGENWGLDVITQAFAGIEVLERAGNLALAGRFVASRLLQDLERVIEVDLVIGDADAAAQLRLALAMQRPRPADRMDYCHVREVTTDELGGELARQLELVVLFLAARWYLQAEVQVQLWLTLAGFGVDP